jgi:hypothetical protein
MYYFKFAFWVVFGCCGLLVAWSAMLIAIVVLAPPYRLFNLVNPSRFPLPPRRYQSQKADRVKTMPGQTKPGTSVPFVESVR